MFVLLATSWPEAAVLIACAVMPVLVMIAMNRGGRR